MLQAGSEKRWLGQMMVWMALAAVALLLMGCAGRMIPASADENSTAASTGVQERLVPNRFVVVYASGVVPNDAASRVSAAGGVLKEVFASLGMMTVECDVADAAKVMANLQADGRVQYVLHDRVVQARKLQMRALPEGTTSKSTAPPSSGNTGGSTGGSSNNSGGGDEYYSQTPQGWAVSQVGGYGGGIVSGSGAPTHGPWDVTMGSGIRIAILDSGVDEAHPDIAPNLGANLSEVSLAELPSACDDGTPWDQAGHGTWVASLAAGAAGSSTGEVIGVAPQATILNIKVLERIASTGGSSMAANCEAGEASGLLSWVISGINDAMSQNANVIVLSLGTLIDLDTGDGAGWQATFNSVTYRAFSSGTLIVAAAGNDSFDLSGGRYIDLPAQARDVLPVVASSNPVCAENLTANAPCVPGPVSLAYYSNFGASLGAVAAPGGSYPEGSDSGVSGYVRGACSNGEIETADGTPATGASFGCFAFGHQQYVQASGTSASAPLAGGVAALIMAAHPGWSVSQVVSAMQSTSTGINYSAGMSFGFGQLNAAAVVY